MGKKKSFVGVPTKEVKETPKEIVIEEPKPEPEIAKVKIAKGIVRGVQLHLNVRSTPEVKGDNVVTIIKNATEVEVINPDKQEEGSGEKWYKIKIFNVEPNIEGYVMAKYISVIV